MVFVQTKNLRLDRTDAQTMHELSVFHVTVCSKLARSQIPNVYGMALTDHTNTSLIDKLLRWSSANHSIRLLNHTIWHGGTRHGGWPARLLPPQLGADSYLAPNQNIRRRPQKIPWAALHCTCGNGPFHRKCQQRILRGQRLCGSVCD
jgi:hypothetical protein